MFKPVFLLFILLPLTGFSQDEEPPFEIRTYEIFEVEKMPGFPGGDSAFMEYIYSKLYYTPELAAQNIEGTAVVKFVVETDGSLSNIKTLKYIGGDFSYLVEMALMSSPKWKPGIARGQRVGVQLTKLIPINLTTCRVDPEGKRVIAELIPSGKSDSKSNELTPEQLKIRRQERLKNAIFEEYEVDESPVFAGGENAFMQYLKENIYYTPEAQKLNFQGNISFVMVIEKDGTVSEVYARETGRGGLEKVVITALQNSPKWSPAKIGKTIVRSKSVVFISFKPGMPVYLPPAPPGPTESAKKKTPDPLKVYQVKKVDQAPQFPGGEEALNAFITKALDYPERAANWHTKLPALYEFVVEADGSITWLRMIKDPGYSQGRKGIDIINKMPKWTPGTKNGVPVRVNYVLPIEFKLQ